MPWIRVKKKPPHDQDDWVSIHVNICKQSDGVTRVYKTDGLLDDDGEHLHTYIWEEGNYSCDCNRYLFYQRAHGEEERDEDCTCGDGGYVVWIVNPATGDIVYDER